MFHSRLDGRDRRPRRTGLPTRRFTVPAKLLRSEPTLSLSATVLPQKTLRPFMKQEKKARELSDMHAR